MKNSTWMVMVLVVAVIAGSAAADSVQYELTFDATWSAATHPQDFPGNAHFSPLVGTAHNANVSFWADGQLASLGIKNVAETGSGTALAALIDAATTAGNASGPVSSPGGNGSPGMNTVTFTVDSAMPLVTFVTMIAPSPDWFVGVHDISLRQGGAWLDNVVVDLDPYDAGTDDGTTFVSPNAATVPPVPISEITGFPFEGTGPLGTFTFRIVPEPATMSLLALAAVSLLRRKRR